MSKIASSETACEKIHTNNRRKGTKSYETNGPISSNGDVWNYVFLEHSTVDWLKYKVNENEWNDALKRERKIIIQYTVTPDGRYCTSYILNNMHCLGYKSNGNFFFVGGKICDLMKVLIWKWASCCLLLLIIEKIYGNIQKLFHINTSIKIPDFKAVRKRLFH